MATYEITAELNLKKIIDESREVAQALNEFADNLERIEKKYAEPQISERNMKMWEEIFKAESEDKEWATLTKRSESHTNKDGKNQFADALKEFKKSDVFKEEGKKKKVEPKNEEEKNKTLLYLRPQLKSLIARDLWDLTEYFRVWNENSDIIKKALEVLESDKAK